MLGPILADFVFCICILYFHKTYDVLYKLTSKCSDGTEKRVNYQVCKTSHACYRTPLLTCSQCLWFKVCCCCIAWECHALWKEIVSKLCLIMCLLPWSEKNFCTICFTAASFKFQRKDNALLLMKIPYSALHRKYDFLFCIAPCIAIIS